MIHSFQIQKGSYVTQGVDAFAIKGIVTDTDTQVFDILVTFLVTLRDETKNAVSPGTCFIHEHAPEKKDGPGLIAEYTDAHSRSLRACRAGLPRDLGGLGLKNCPGGQKGRTQCIHAREVPA